MSSTPIPIRPNDRLFVLTGAGISAESGIRTFRDAGGLWENHRFEDVASPEGFERDPKTVWRFYSQRREQMAGCRPNAAHVALGDLQKRLGDRLFLCTQNVDDLHERGGSTGVVHMHGELAKTRCDSCDRPPFVDVRTYMDAVPRCERCGGRLRPHIVWFGEVPFAMDRIVAELGRATVFACIGSSGAVYPAAAFVRQVNGRARTVYIGPEAPENAGAFGEFHQGPATTMVPRAFDVEAG